MSSLIRTIDAHVAGASLRLVVDGFPSPPGTTMAAKRDWVSVNADVLRRSIMLEPRGHADMCGAVLTEPVSPAAHAGVLFFENDGYSAMSGHGIIAVTTIALERGLLMPGGDGTAVVFDTPAGVVRAKAVIRAEPSGTARVERVSFTNVPAFVVFAGLAIQAAGRHLRVDVAYGGEFYAIVDSEAAGVAIDGAHVPELRRTAAAIRRSIESVVKTIAHPLEDIPAGLHGTIFTGPAHADGADLRNVTVFADGQVDRSPGGTGMSAVMSVLDAMDLLDGGKPFVEESIIGTRLSGRIAGRTEVGGHPAVMTDIEGSAWITGEHTFVTDDRDPLKEGFRL
jgi:trans-L-3-hydroxyproline dehydratase